jgi:hypothetical protein
MAVIKALTSGGVRRELDFYPTPPEATRALLSLIQGWPANRIWEPCCGDGAIAKVLEAEGFTVIASDLADRGYGEPGVDFFKTGFSKGEALITNPPFGRADDFIRHADRIGVQRMALLLKINFFSAAKRLNVWGTWRPRLVAPMTWRLDFTGAGSPHTDCMWVLWDRSDRLTEYELLRKPA